MGWPDHEFVDAASISETLRCPACFQVFQEPVYCAGSPCEHAFCYGCVLRRAHELPPESEHSEGSDTPSSDDGHRPHRAQCAICESLVVEDVDSEEERDHLQLEAPAVENTTASACLRCPVCQLGISEGSLRPHRVLTAIVDELQVYCERRCGWTGRRDLRLVHAEQSCPMALLESVQLQLDAAELQIEELVAQREERIRRSMAVDNDSRLTERDARISALESKIALRDERLIDLGRQLVQREVRIAQLENLLTDQDAQSHQVVLTERHRYRVDPFLSSAPPTARSVRAASCLEDVIAGDDLDM